MPIGAAAPEPRTILVKWDHDATFSVGIADEQMKELSQPAFSRIHNVKRGLSRKSARAEVARLKATFPSVRLTWGESFLEGR